MMFRNPIAPAVVAAGMAQLGPTVRKFAPRAPLALNPAAFGIELLLGEPPERKVEHHGDVAVVEIVGPLMHHAEKFCDSYDAIKARVAEALASSAKCVLLSIDSPGGVVAGCFDCVSELRAMSAAAGKPLHAYVDAQATSAAYALCCAADKVWIPPAGIVGSIGVIDAVLDATAQDAFLGLAFTLVTSGERKSDGNPHTATTPEAVEAVQSMVDTLAGQFFGVVADRRGLEADAVRGLNAGLLVGQQAIDAGLADAVATFDEVVAALNAEPTPDANEETAPPADAIEAAKLARTHVITNQDSAPTGATTATAEAEASNPTDTDRKGPHMSKLAEVKAGLQAAIDDEESTPEERNAARKALSALGADAAAEDKEAAAAEDGDEKHEEPDGDEPKGEGDEEPDGDEEKPEDDKDKPAEASALALAEQVQALSAWKAQSEAKAERAGLMALRPDFAAATVAWLNSQPLATVRSACKSPDKGGLPRGAGKGGQVGAARAAATSAATPTAGAGEPRLPPPVGPVVGRSNLSGEGDRMDRQMGLHTDRAPLEVSGNTVVMRAIKRADAVRQTAARNGAK
jgi:signal peptide peptidase SppA